MNGKRSQAAVLIDHNIEWQATLLWSTLRAEGWLELYPLEILMFHDVGLAHESNDRDLWRFAQKSRMILLTANRNMDGKNSLEQTIREENTPTSLPVLTISQEVRLREREYRTRCAERLLEIVLDIENYLGVGRIFIP
jgi:hypothetical protein